MGDAQEGRQAVALPPWLRDGMERHAALEVELQQRLMPALSHAYARLAEGMCPCTGVESNDVQLSTVQYIRTHTCDMFLPIRCEGTSDHTLPCY